MRAFLDGLIFFGLMVFMQRSKSSQRWLKEHFDDPFVKQAHAEGYRSRAVYKIKEIDEKERIFWPGMTVLDLGAAPGGWTQYVSQRLAGSGRIVALDILPMDPIPGVDFILGDFQDESILQSLCALVPEHSADVILSDMAPNMSGNVSVDITRAMALVELALDVSLSMLKPGGVLVMKVFHGSGFDALVKQTRAEFEKVIIRKPKASRARSRETYLLAKGYHIK